MLFRSNYFDLEDPAALSRLEQPDTALRHLRGTVVIDEIQRRPDLFPLLRVLADRRPLPARFLILGSAGYDLLRQSSESLAGPRVRLGRETDNTIELHDDEASRHHAEILIQGTAATVRDLNSSNGTYLNDQRITESLLQIGRAHV